MANPVIPNQMSYDEAAALVAQADRLDLARAIVQDIGGDKRFTKVKILLDGGPDASGATLVSNAQLIGTRFKSLLVVDASDSTATINFRASKQAHEDDVPMVKNFGVAFDSTQLYGSFWWTAQAGKWVTILIARDSKITSGQFNTTSTGGVVITDGANAPTLNVTTLVAATAAVISPADTNRKTSLLQNKTGASLWVGPSTVTSAGATRGIEVAPDQTFTWKNPTALSGYSVGGGVVVEMEET